jgi:hypothetical protein
MAQEDFSTSFTTHFPLKLLLHKITHWEYWPFQVIYIPIYFLWASMKAKSIFSLMPLIQLSKTEGLLWYQKKQFII